MKKLSVVVPVYYNEGSLSLLFGELSAVERSLEERGLAMELIFVDDGSGDGSLCELLKIKAQRPETKVVKLSRNFGAVHATSTGVRFVTGDCWTVLAADLQDPPPLILKMADRWMAGCKYVVCVRTGRDDPLSTRVFAALYYALVHLLVMKDYPRQGFDLALMDKVMLPYMQQSAKNVNPHLFAYWLGFRPETILYQRQERTHGKSRWTFTKKLKFFIDSILGFSILPIRLMSATGIGMSVLSLVYGIWVAINALLGRAEVRGFATIVAMIAFFMGIMATMLGIIGEYVWRIFDEVGRKPEAVIDEIY